MRCPAIRRRHRRLPEVSGGNLVDLFIIAIPVACIAWTVTHEEIFRELRDWCSARSRTERGLFARKMYYVFTCEYCFSHYVAAAVVAITHFQLLFADWRGYAIAGFSLVWVANIYMTIFGRLRLDIKYEGVEIAAEQEKLASEKLTPRGNGLYKDDRDPARPARRLDQPISVSSE